MTATKRVVGRVMRGGRGQVGAPSSSPPPPVAAIRASRVAKVGLASPPVGPRARRRLVLGGRVRRERKEKK
jgi:hypothetical protein